MEEIIKVKQEYQEETPEQGQNFVKYEQEEVVEELF